MRSPPEIPAALDLTLRVGCSLVYEVTGTASLLLILRPRPGRNHLVLAEALALGLNNDLRAEEFSDVHGNTVCRVTLAPGRNLFRHDALVAVSSRPDNHMDFHAYAEVFVAGNWFTTDARFHVPRIGRIKVSCGLDAVDGAFSTIYGGATLSYFQVWAYQVARGTVGVGDPLDLSQRLDNQWAVQRDAPGATSANP